MQSEQSGVVGGEARPVRTEGTAMAVVSIILGLGGGIPLLGLLSAALGLYLGSKARKTAQAVGNGTGATLGIIGVVICGFMLAVALVILLFAGSAISMLGTHRF